MQERIQALRENIVSVYMGNVQAVDRLIVCLLARGHALIEDVPGVGKTVLANALARSIQCSFSRLQCTPDLLPSDITGTSVFRQDSGTFEFRKGPIFANVVLADEINRAPAKTQSALLEAMQEKQVTIEGDRFELGAPFLVLATQNPIDLEGTYPLPEAQIDRFLVRVPIGYPTHRDEVSMLRTHNADVPLASAVLSPEDVRSLQSIAARIHVEDDLYDFAVALTAFTRTHPKVALGASPRATLNLVQAAKGAAVLGGRPYVTPDDIRELAVNVLAHRLVLVPEVEGDERVRTQVVEEALSKVGYRRAARPM
jgi:MoxR-like ATPase